LGKSDQKHRGIEVNLSLVPKFPLIPGSQAGAWEPRWGRASSFSQRQGSWSFLDSITKLELGNEGVGVSSLVPKLPLENRVGEELPAFPNAREAGASWIALPSWSLVTRGTRG